MTEMSGSDGPEAANSRDLTDVVHRLRRNQIARKVLEAEYELLRDQAVALFHDTHQGSLLFIDPETGEKKVASPVVPEKLVVDLEELAGRVPDDVYGQVTKTVPAQIKLDRDAFERLVLAGEIPADVLAAVATYVPQTAYISFAKPEDDAASSAPA